jgi:hypothetical protein
MITVLLASDNILAKPDTKAFINCGAKCYQALRSKL